MNGRLAARYFRAASVSYTHLDVYKRQRICKSNGVEMWIVNGGKDEFAVKALRGEIEFSKVI